MRRRHAVVRCDGGGGGGGGGDGDSDDIYDDNDAGRATGGGIAAEGGMDADCGSSLCAAAALSFDATAAVGEEGMAMATTYDDNAGATGGGIAGGGGGVDADRGSSPCAAAALSFYATAPVGEEGMAMANGKDIQGRREMGAAAALPGEGGGSRFEPRG